jgi:hypothetical protein
MTPERAGERAKSRPAATSRRRAATKKEVPADKPRGTLRVIETRVYRGPNYWSYDPTIKLVVDLGVLEAFPTNLLPGFTDALLSMLPGVGHHSCSTGRAGGFAKRLRDGTWVGHVAEHVALQLQRDAGTEVGRGKTRSTGEPGRYHVVYSYAEESVGLAAGRLAVRLVNHLVEPGNSTWRPSSSSSSSSPSGRPSARRPRRCSTRPACATSPGSGSTTSRWSSSGTASTRSGSGPR